MKGIIKFNGKLYAPLEEGAYSIQGKIVEVVESKPVEEEIGEWFHECKHGIRVVNPLSQNNCFDCGRIRPSPVKSEEKKCEHDKGDHWEKDKKTKLTKFTSTASGNAELCPFCPKPEERSPEEIAKNLVDRIKFEINTMSEMGGHGGSNKLATMHFYECVERLSADAIKAERNRGGGK